MEEIDDIIPEGGTVTQVYLFTNGMAMVFNQHGKQMPEFQGRIQEAFYKMHEAGVNPESYTIDFASGLRPGINGGWR